MAYSKFVVATVLLAGCLLTPQIGAAQITFGSPTDYPVGATPEAVTTGDFNNDGKLDLAVANVSSNDISVLLGNGDGTFRPAVNYAAGQGAWSITANDFNGDGKPDLAVANNGSPNVSILLGNGDGTFRTHVDYDTGNGLDGIVSGDFNLDSKMDVAVCSGAGTVSVLLGKGDGSFQAAVHYAAGSSPQGLTLADFNGDGKADLAVAGVFSGGPVGIMESNGDGTFQPPVIYGPAGIGTSVAAADFNGDGKFDLAVTSLVSIFTFSSDVDLLLGNGDGTFSQGSAPNTGACQNYTPFAADFDGDHNPDLADFGDDQCQPNPKVDPRVLVLAGSGDGAFQTPVSFSAAQHARLGAAVDLDSNKSPDLIVLNNADNTISILLNTVGTDFSVSASPLSPGTVSRGQTATSTITLTLLNAFDNSVSLSCLVQPAQAGSPTCSISPNQVAFDASGTASAQLTATAGTTASALLPQPADGQDSRSWLFLWLPVAGLAFLGTGVSRGSSSRRRLLGLFVGCFLFAGLILQSACGGGSSNSGGPKSQTYTVTVTGTSGSTQHSTTVTLTVSK